MTSPNSAAGGATNFAAYTVPELTVMLYAGSPTAVRNAGETWDDTGNSLHDQANRLERRLSNFSGAWTGGAADQYMTMVTDLIGGIRKVADTAYSMRNLAYDAADAQDKARAQMPAAVDVPVLAPTTVALASSPIQVDVNTPASVVAQIQQARANAVAAVQAQQQAQAASSAAHAQAVQVMTTLAGNYVAAKDSIPPSPTAAVVPTVTTTSAITPNTSVSTPIGTPLNLLATNGPWRLSGNLNDPPGGASGQSGAVPATGGPATVSPNQPQQSGNSLFGDMFTAGVAAASAAVFGRFGSIIPKVPGWANKNSNPNGTTGSPNSTSPTDAPKLGAKMAGGAALGGGALGAMKGLGGGIGGVGGMGAPAAPSLLSAAGAGGGDLAAGVAGGVAGAAATGAQGSPMMPMMPMGGMGAGAGGDMGGGRRIPPWLVETQDVWGESSTVSPTVIGEEPDLGGGQNWLG